jgi:3-hydroxyisobutyrate dehydrogenase-like beta-hydroxyacid dehydrogenase
LVLVPDVIEPDQSPLWRQSIIVRKGIESMKKKVGFLGLGIMGYAMAVNVAKAGYQVTVYNRTPKDLGQLKDAGLEAASSPKVLAEKSDIIIAMVTGPEALDQLLWGENGAAQAFNREKIFVNMSTVSPMFTKSLAEKLAASGVGFIDAPVSGSKKPAEDATLLILAGGPKDMVDALSPLFKTMGKKVIYCGEAGQGSMMKMANNLLLGMMIEGLAETLLFGRKGGLAFDALVDVILSGPLNCGIFQMKIPMLNESCYDPSFPLKHATKDLKFLMETASDMGVMLPAGQTMLNLFRIGVAKDWGDLDICAILKVLENINKD